METVRVGVGVVLPYIAVAVFLAGMAWRFYRWKKLASPPITLFPAPAGGAANAWNTLQEAVLFRSLFKGDHALWALAWVFHATLVLILVGHLRVFFNADALLMDLGMTEAGIQAMSSGAGGAAGLVIIAAALALLARRLVMQRVREITGVSDCLVLLLLGAIILTGNLMRFGAEHFDLAVTRSYFAALASFSGAAGAAALDNNLFILHLALAMLLLIILPFSKLLHFGGIFFTQQLIHKP